MKMKWIALLLVAAMMFVLVACGGGDESANQGGGNDSTNESGNNDGGDGTTDAADPIELTWAGWSAEEEASGPVINSMIDDWNDANPNATVRWIGWPWGDTLQQLIIRTQGGEDLDVAQIDMGWLETLADMDVLVDLNTVIGEDWLTENVEGAALAAGNVNGKQLGIPWTTASIGMVYNPSILEEAGVNTPPTTIQEFEDALQKIKETHDDVIPYAMTTKDAGSMSKDFLAWLWTFGGNAFDENGNVTVNSEAGIETLTWLKSLVDNGYASMDIGRFEAREMYAVNRVGFYDDAIFARGTLQSNGAPEDELSNLIQPMLRPVVNNGDHPQSILWGHQLVVFKNAQDHERSGEFIKHLISPEQSLKYFNTVDLPPVRSDVIESDEVQSNDWVSEWMGITGTGRKAETQEFTNTSELETIMTEELQAALLGAKTVEKALEDMENRLQSALN